MPIDTVLVVVGASMLVIGLISRLLERLFLSTVLVALGIGIVLGPEVLAVIEPSREGDSHKLMEETARVTLAIALMASGLQITRADLRENARRVGALLTAGMLGMWIMSGLGAWLLLDLPFWLAFLLGAIVTPTDPVVSSTVVTGPLAEKSLPRRVRRTLQLEAGANDGLALPLVLLTAYMATGFGGNPFAEWIVEAAKQIALALAVGGAIGLGGGWLLAVSVEEGELEQANLIGIGIAIALLTLGLVHLLGGSGILATFVAALVFSTRQEEHVREIVREVQEAVARFFVLPAFILFGAILPFADWAELGIAGFAFAAWILVLRRPPVVPVVLAGSGTPRSERTFLAWFGPLGVAAIFYATFVERFTPAHGETIFAAATVAICASVLVHSITATPAVRMLAGRSTFATLRAPFDPDSEQAP